MTDHIDPDCLTEKHRACPGWTFDPDTDKATDCACACHVPEVRDAP